MREVVAHIAVAQPWLLQQLAHRRAFAGFLPEAVNGSVIKLRVEQAVHDQQHTKQGCQQNTQIDGDIGEHRTHHKSGKHGRSKPHEYQRRQHAQQGKEVAPGIAIQLLQ